MGMGTEEKNQKVESLTILSYYCHIFFTLVQTAFNETTVNYPALC